MQLSQGYARLEPAVYLQVIVLIALPSALAITALAMGVHALVNQKFVGHLIIIAYWVLLQVVSTLGFDHRLYQIARPPDFTYSDMAGWGPYTRRVLTISVLFHRLLPNAGIPGAARARARDRRLLVRSANPRRETVASRWCGRRGSLRGGGDRARVRVLS